MDKAFLPRVDIHYAASRKIHQLYHLELNKTTYIWSISAHEWKTVLSTLVESAIHTQIPGKTVGQSSVKRSSIFSLALLLP